MKIKTNKQANNVFLTITNTPGRALNVTLLYNNLPQCSALNAHNVYLAYCAKKHFADMYNVHLKYVRHNVYRPYVGLDWVLIGWYPGGVWYRAPYSANKSMIVIPCQFK